MDHAAKSVRYHAFRSRELPKDHKGLFSRDSDHAGVNEFIKTLDDPLTRPRRTRQGEIQYPVMHRLMFSLSRKEFERCGFTNWQPVIREALATFEREHDMCVEWVAAEHQSLHHPHVHVDIKSVYTHTPTGKRHRLRITQEMRLELRQNVERIMERERTHVREIQALERGMDRFADQIGRSVAHGLVEAGREEPDRDWLRIRRKRRQRPEDREHRDDGHER